MNSQEIAQSLLKAKSSKKNTKKLLNKIKGLKPREIDSKFHEAHEEVFENFDCLDCANCCKTTSPIFKDRDIDRIASHLKMKPFQFIDKYLKLDQDQDYVLQVSPCHFLQDDNKCSIYDVRPAACKEYPHTDRKKMSQLLNLTYKNTLVCPAVGQILEKIRKGLHP